MRGGHYGYFGLFVYDDLRDLSIASLFGVCYLAGTLKFGLCPCGSGVEHTLGKGEVESSSLSMGSIL